jgi:hypothetical protein
MPDEKKPELTASAPKPATTRAAASISFDAFTESTLSAVMRAASVNKLQHVPIVIGLIFHPGLGGYGGGPATCGFASTVKPFFTDCYRQHMMFMFDLWSATDCENHWQGIHDAVNNGTMPAPGCPGSFDKNAFLTAFQCWKDQGFPA